MLTIEDAATIRNAIIKRLDKERGVKICDILIGGGERLFGFSLASTAIRVGILTLLDDELVVRSRFDLPPEFEIGHLHNEIDEIAEQFKAARLDFWGRGATLREPEKQLAGTGLRGRWPKV